MATSTVINSNNTINDYTDSASVTLGTVSWNDGTSDKITISQGTSGKVYISSSTCEGVDRTKVVTFKTSNNKASANLTVNQTGKREIFTTSGGGFLLSDGSSFNVLKS
jgi:hypothetical protein